MGLILHPRKIQVSIRDVKIISQLHTSIICSKYSAVNLVVFHSAVFLVLTSERKDLKCYCSALNAKIA